MATRNFKYSMVCILALLLAFTRTNAQTITFTKTNVTCNGGSNGTITIALSAGGSQYRYVYYKTFLPSVSDSFGPTNLLTHTFNGLGPDFYTVFVRDVTTDDVIDFNTIQITQPAVLGATVTSSNVTCFGSNNGSITVSSPTGGSGAYEYTSNGGTSWQSSGLFTLLPPATYNVQIRDKNDPTCIKILNGALVISQPAVLNATLSSTNVTCFGKSNGTIVISSPTGGSGSYQYSRNGGTTWQASGTFSQLAPGTYNVVMRDQAVPTCTRTLNAALVITQPAQLAVTDITIIKGLTCNEGSDGILQSVVTGGTTPYTYDWYVNNSGSWVTINQHNQSATSIPKGWYEVRVNDANNCGNPTPATARELFLEGVTDSIPPAFVFDSASVVSTCAGQSNGSITIYAHGGVTPSRYSITNGGGSGYQAGNVFGSLSGGVYQTWAMDKKGCKKSGPNKTVATTPNLPVSVSITANPAGSICPGTSVTFTATPVNGGTTPVYQWKLNGTNVGTGASTYTNAALVAGDQVSVQLTSSLRCNSGNPATSNTITAALLSPPAITGQPANVSQCAGTNATFTVTATGSGLTYQWKKNGVNIGGATNASYTINNIVAGDAASYTVTVTGTCGAVTSNPATLTISTAPAITGQPAGATQCAGTNVTFTVTATGTGLTYQWRKNTVNIGGATNASYTINNIASTDAASYDVVITGTCGTATSNAAVLVVNPATAITGQPVSVTQCTGTNVTFTVTATGASLTYQWRKAGVNIGGATSASYTLNNIIAANAGNYDVVVTGACGSATSNIASLTVNTAPAITAQPASLVLCAGGNATFSVTATGTGITYQWQKSGVNIGGATNASYTINNIAPADAGSYTVVITGTCGNITSNAATLTVNTAPAITGQPASATQCAGTNVTFTVTATGTGLTYQWRKNSVNIAGATNASYTLNNIIAANAGNYDVVVTGTCGTATSNIAALTVNTAPAITAQPVSLAQCAGTNATFSVTATGTGLTYQWQKGGVNIGGATNATYTINNIAAGDAGSYTVVITGTCGNITSGAATLTVNTAPAITGQPASATQCAGTNVTFAVTATGTGLTYQWRKNSVNIAGATNASLTLNNITAADAAGYDVVITGTCGNATSNAATLVVNTAPAITTQPASLTQCAGTNATFTVTATGTGITYQWQKNTVNIAGATNASYTINNISAADAASYRVVITGTCGNLTSSAATLTVNAAPAITGQPASLTLCTGANATFTVTATGTGLTYQWRKNGTNIAGATNAGYTINNITAADAANYDVVITGTCGNLTSNIATLTVNTAPAITAQPVSLTQCEGTNAAFTVTATGTGLTYQWRKNAVNIPGAVNASYTINNITAADAATYTVVITGTCGNLTSAAATLTVNTSPAITAQPASLVLCSGANATFRVTATGTGLTYQWRKNGTNIAGATNATYTINNITIADAGNYDVLITGTCAAATSNIATLTVNVTPSITTQPVSLTQCEGTNATFTVVATGSGLTYQWRKGGANIAGATNASYTINNIAPADAGSYTVVITGTCGNLTSAAATLTVNRAPAITTQPAATTACEGTTANFSVTATGAGLSYQWRKNGINIAGAVNQALSLPAITISSAGSYDVVITGSCGSVTSNAAVLTVAELPQITLQPVDQEICEGSDVSFSVTATGTNLTYQWRRNGTNLPGKTTPLLSLTAVSASQSGDYDVLVYGTCDTLTSNKAVLLVDPATAVVSSDDDTLVCEGSTVDFNIVANGFGAKTYQWQWLYTGSWIDLTDGGDISGATTPHLRIQNAEAADSGYYRCFVTSGCGTAYSDSMNLDINLIVATIGTPAPFLIDSTTTEIKVGVVVTDRFLNWDLGFALVAPDGTEVMLKAPMPFWCILNPFNNGVDGTFTNTIDKSTGDTLDYCVNTKPLTGTFAATGNWNVLHGKDPANGAWQIRVYDADKSVPDPDGFIKLATLSFTDLDQNGDTAVITYNSGAINENVLNPISGELRPTSFVVPIRLMTSCFNSEDARAVVTVKGGIPPFTYQWTGPTTEPNSAQVDLGAGTYSVLVTDAMGCSSVATVEVSAPPAIVIDTVFTSDTLACFGSTDGFIKGKAHGGSGQMTYHLLPGNLTSSVPDSAVFLNLAAGIYTLRAMDPNGCSYDSVITLYQRSQIVVQIVTVPKIGTTPGSITLTASGGTAPYRYSIDNGATLQVSGVFDSLDMGIYHVFVQDTNGCVFTQDVSLSVDSLHVNVIEQDISCFGVADGSFLLTTVDGVAPYTLTGSWLTDPYISDDGLISFTGQTAGDYDLMITDSEGRLFSDTVHIIEPAQIAATSVITNASCSAITKDGAIDLTVTGGTGTMKYTWSTGDTIQDIINIEAGNYSVTIVDSNLCSAMFDFAVPGTNVATANAGLDDTICPGSEYQLVGSVGDSMRWEPADLTDNPDIYNPTVNILNTTQFIYTVYQNGCMDRDTVELSAYERIGMDIYDPSGQVNIDTALFLLEGETYTMAATPGFESYLWQPGDGLSDPAAEAVVVSPAVSNYYTVFGTTADGCIETDRVHVVIAKAIRVYTGFSPNGDGVNDKWIITHAVEYGDRIHVRVFNRWGETVFESTGYGGSQEWDGTRNSRPMPVGAYYYIIDVDDGKTEPYTGTVTILR